MTLWGTKVWDEVKTEERRDITRPRPCMEPGPTCIATVGIDGFTQDAWRVFYRRYRSQTEKFTWCMTLSRRSFGEAPADDDR